MDVFNFPFRLDLRFARPESNGREGSGQIDGVSLLHLYRQFVVLTKSGVGNEIVTARFGLDAKDKRDMLVS